MSVICYSKGTLAVDAGGAKETYGLQQRVEMNKIAVGWATEPKTDVKYPAFAVAMCGDKLLPRQLENLVRDIGCGLYLHYFNDCETPVMIQPLRAPIYRRTHLILMTADQVFEYTGERNADLADPILFTEFAMDDTIAAGLGGHQALVCLAHGMPTAKALLEVSKFRGDEPHSSIDYVDAKLLVKPRLIKDPEGKLLDVSYIWPRRTKKVPVPPIARLSK